MGCYLQAMSELQIRRATREDLSGIGRLGAGLSLQHHGYDSARFALFEPLVEEYTRFFEGEISSDGAALLVAEMAGAGIVGYVFVRMEPESFLSLCRASAWIHDIFVDESARGARVGPALMQAAIEAGRGMGAESVMLSVSPKNERARKMFAGFGFRETMLEMRMEL